MIPLEYLTNFVKDNGPYAFTIEELKEWLSSKYPSVDSLTMSESILNLNEIIPKGRVYIISSEFVSKIT